eukprot:jgi/Chlat1/7535/Chrsp62S07047
MRLCASLALPSPPPAHLRPSPTLVQREHNGQLEEVAAEEAAEERRHKQVSDMGRQIASDGEDNYRHKHEDEDEEREEEHDLELPTTAPLLSPRRRHSSSGRLRDDGDEEDEARRGSAAAASASDIDAENELSLSSATRRRLALGSCLILMGGVVGVPVGGDVGVASGWPADDAFRPQTHARFRGGARVCYNGAVRPRAHNAGILRLHHCRLLNLHHGVGAAAAETASLAIMTELYPDNVASVMGFSETALGFGFMIGAPLGGVLYQFGGFLLPFIVMGAMPSIVLALTYSYLPASPISASSGPTKDEQRAVKATIKAALAEGPAASALASACAVSIVFGATDVILPPQLVDVFGLKPSILGVVFGVGGISYTLSSLPLGAMMDAVRLPHLITMATGLLVLGASMWGIGITCRLAAPSLPGLLVAETLLGVSSSLAMVPIIPFVLECCAAVHGGSAVEGGVVDAVSSLFSAAFYLGASIGPLLGSALVHLIGFLGANVAIALICRRQACEEESRIASLEYEEKKSLLSIRSSS